MGKERDQGWLAQQGRTVLKAMRIGAGLEAEGRGWKGGACLRGGVRS